MICIVNILLHVLIFSRMIQINYMCTVGYFSLRLTELTDHDPVSCQFLRSVSLAIKMLPDVWKSENNPWLMFQQPRCHRESARATHTDTLTLGMSRGHDRCPNSLRESRFILHRLWLEFNIITHSNSPRTQNTNIKRFSHTCMCAQTHLWHSKNMFCHIFKSD